MIGPFDGREIEAIAHVVFFIRIRYDRFILQNRVQREMLREVFYKFRCILASIASDMC